MMIDLTFEFTHFNLGIRLPKAYPFCPADPAALVNLWNLHFFLTEVMLKKPETSFAAVAQVRHCAT
jgi:hypothetical protein